MSVRIFLTNKSKHGCLCCIDGGETVILPPLKRIAVECDECAKILITHQYKSNYEKKKGRIKYYLAINSEYVFEGIRDGEEFSVSYEKICFNRIPQVFYERFFLYGDKAILKSENHKVSDEEKIKAFYVKENRRSVLGTLLLWEPLVDAPFWGVLILIGLVMWNQYGWEFGAVYFVVLYLIIVLSALLSDLISGKLFGSRKDERKKFFSFFTNNYISSYYSSLGRESLDDEYETE